MICHHCGLTTRFQITVLIDGQRVTVCADGDQCRKNRTVGSEHSAPAPADTEKITDWAADWNPEPYDPSDWCTACFQPMRTHGEDCKTGDLL